MSYKRYIASEGMDNEITAYKDAILNGKYNKALQIAEDHANSHEQIKYFYENIVKPALYSIGEMWEYNVISVAAEHLATSISESIMNHLYSRIINTKRVNKKIVLGCIEGEYHQVGIKMIADIFEMNGWDTFFLGANVPNDELIKYAIEIQPDIVAMSLSIYSHLPAFEVFVSKIKMALPEVKIIVGGQGFRHGGDKIFQSDSRIKFMTSFEQIEQYIFTFQNHE